MTEPYQPPQPPQPPPPGGGFGAPQGTGQTNGLAVAGMVTGICSIGFCWSPFLGAVLGIVGVVLGFVGLGKANQMGGTGRGMAIAGIVTGAIGILVSIVIFIIALQAVNEANEILEGFDPEDFN